LALALLGSFYVLLWMYFLGFELLWGGQTPGKWMLKLRVVSETGGPAPASAIFVRNLLRLVDALPVIVVHLLGGVVMFLSPRCKRIGDLAAGTVVVRERALSRGMRDLDVTALRARGARHEDDLDDEETALVRRFVERKHELTQAALAGVAQRVVAVLAQRRELPSADPVKLLSLLDQGHSPHELREASGPRVAPPNGNPPPPPRPVTEFDG
jgi:hypothetical protein